MVKTGVKLTTIEFLEIRYREKVERFYQELKNRPGYVRGYLNSIGPLSKILIYFSFTEEAAKMDAARRVLRESRIIGNLS